uniref:Ubiquinol-cytochrome c reductase complex assembly factor 4 n=1 Tax=Scophthalmus maximus TaxID=52904 RepID=A0A8D3C103_SCOMX
QCLIYFSVVVGRVNSVRPLALSSRRPARSKKPTDDSEVKSEPVKFSASKASNSSWKVDQAMGSKFERPWWKVLPISLIATGLLLWCVLRGETDFDVLLEKQLFFLPPFPSNRFSDELPLPVLTLDAARVNGG